MRPKITVVGGGELAATLAERDYATVVSGRNGDDVSGSDVVVLAEQAEGLFDAIRDRAPNAVVIVAGDSPAAVCEATLFPRSRILGVEDVASVPDVVDSIVLDRGQVFTAIARCEGERGIESEFAAVPVRIGAGGIHEILEG
ncbi:MAG: hypothetical protein ACJ76Z_02840 [Thermoleophilaceae bacterium]